MDTHDEAAPPKKSTISVAGLVMIATCVVLVVVSSFFRGVFFEHGPGEEAPIPPYLFTYVNTSGLAVYLCVVLCRGDQTKEKAPKSIAELMRIGVITCPWYFLMAATYNFSLEYTSVSDAVTGSMTTPVWTYVLCVGIFRSETFSWRKTASVIVCLLGVLIVAISDSQAASVEAAATVRNSTLVSSVMASEEESASSVLMGDALAIASAMCMATYTVISSRAIPDASPRQTAVILGFLGVTALVIGFFGLGVCHMSGIEPLRIPPKRLFIFVLVHAATYTPSFVFLVTFASSLTSPLVVNAGLVMTIPVSVIVDSSLHHALPEPGALLGNALCVVGFITLLRASA